MTAPQSFDLPAPYTPSHPAEGVIRIWGHGAYAGRVDFVGALVQAWEAGFRRYHPNVRFKDNLCGTAAAIGALYAGVGDLALMGREIWPPEIAAFEEVFGYPPTGVDAFTGSLETRNRDYALAVFVHRDNPLSALTLGQLDAIFSIERRRGHAPIRYWGDLGHTGAWASQPVNLYGLPIARGFAQYFEDTVFLGSRIWNPSLREFPDAPGSHGGSSDGGYRELTALATDRDGIGYAGLQYANPGVKAVALSRDGKEPFVAPTVRSVAERHYPLTRVVRMYFNRPPGQAADPKIAEFLRYLLSRQAQEIVLEKGHGYLPILAPNAAEQLKALQT